MQKNRLPFIEPNSEFSFRIAVALKLLDALSLSNRQKMIMTLDRLQLYLYLSLFPERINFLLRSMQKSDVIFDAVDVVTIKPEFINIDLYIERQNIKEILQFMSAIDVLNVAYLEKEGFVYSLNEKGKSIASQMTSPYFNRLHRYLGYLENFNSSAPAKLIELLNASSGKGA